MSDRVSLGKYLLAIRDGDQRVDAERDRRYAEVALARAEALKIKEEADKTALGLAREIQVYKDEKANELREQINSERGLYVTKTELEPIKAYIAGQTGRGLGMSSIVGWGFAIVMASVAIAQYFKH